MRTLSTALVGVLFMAAAPAWADSRIAYSAADRRDEDIYTALPDGSRKRVITSNRMDDFNPDLAPNGRKIVFARWTPGGSNKEIPKDMLVKVRSSGGAPRVVTKRGSPLSPEWSPDGRRIAYSDAGDIYVIRPDGSHRRRLTDTTDWLCSNDDPSWSPGGKRIVFSALTGDCSKVYPGDYEIFTMRADGSGRRRLTSNERADTQPDWSPDGRRIVFGSGRRLVSTGVHGGDRRVVFETDYFSRSFLFGAAWSPSGKHLVFRGRDGDQTKIFRARADGSHVRKIVANPEWIGIQLSWERKP